MNRLNKNSEYEKIKHKLQDLYQDWIKNDNIEYDRLKRIQEIYERNSEFISENLIFFPEFPLNLEELSDWISDPDAPHAYMRIIKGGDPNNVEDRRCFIEKTPRVFDPTLGIPVINWLSWISGPKGSAPEYGQYEPSRQWCDRYAKWIGYKIK